MADNVYVVESLALPGQATVQISDDGTGIDWIVMGSAHLLVNSIRLQWSFANGQPTSAEGSYSDGVGQPGNRLVVDGIIENARGSDGQDDIAGNILANILYGDPLATGPGGDDILFGDEGNDTIFGGAGNDQINGAEDDDRLFGGDGADTISGALGRDIVEGGAGADILSGGADAGDTVSYLGSAAGVRVSLTFGTTTTGRGGDAAGDQLNGFSDIRGSAFDDVLTDTVAGTIAFGGNDNRFEGRDGNDVLRLGGGDDKGYGGAGNDRIDGEAANDRLDGGTGSDTIFGGEGTDAIWGGQGFDYLSGDEGADTILGGDQRDRIYGGDGNDRLHGEDGGDIIFGNAGDDLLSGGSEDDLLAGLRGADRLQGGAGADEFVFLSRYDGGDRILDLTSRDQVDLQFIGEPTLQWDNAGALGAGRARLVDTGANVELRVNLDSDSAIEFRVTFVNVSSVSQGQVDL